MDRFVSLEVLGRTGKKTSRLFNLRYIKTVDPSACTVLLNGNIKPFLVSRESMDSFLEVTSDGNKGCAE